MHFLMAYQPAFTGPSQWTCVPGRCSEVLDWGFSSDHLDESCDVAVKEIITRSDKTREQGEKPSLFRVSNI